MRLIVKETAEEAGRAAGTELAGAARGAIDNRGRCVIAFSRLQMDSPLLAAFANADLPWDRIHVVQVDERVVPAQDPRRNAFHLRQALTRLPSGHLYEMPVETEDLEAAAHSYEQVLEDLTGKSRPVDVVHLGLGADGHTASLVPGDPVLEETQRVVAVTGLYEGLRRMTLTYRVLNAARRLVWFTAGAAKARALHELVQQTGSSPAVRVEPERAVVIADRAAAPEL